MKKGRERSDSGLTLLVKFLNLDINPATWERLKQCKKGCGPGNPCFYHALFGWSFPPGPITKEGEVVKAELGRIMSDPTHPMHERYKQGDPKVQEYINGRYRKVYGTGPAELNAVTDPYGASMGKMHNLQLEIRSMLLPLIQGETIDHAQLDRVLARINALCLITQWQRFTSPIKPGQSKLRLHKERFFVTSYYYTRDLRQKLFSIIAATLEKNEFPRLKRCPVCSKFFVAKDPRGVFCSPKCKAMHDNKTGKDRVRRCRERKKKQQIMEKKIAKKERDRKCFARFLKMADSKKVADQQVVGSFMKKRDRGGWPKVDEWLQRQKRGDSIEAIWKDIPSVIRKDLVENSPNLSKTG